jgi:hypothetical protein
MSNFLAPSVPKRIMLTCSKASRSPSCIIESTAVASPMRAPQRAFGSMYGAFDMLSMPPARMTS